MVVDIVGERQHPGSTRRLDKESHLLLLGTGPVCPFLFHPYLFESKLTAKESGSNCWTRWTKRPSDSI